MTDKLTGLKNILWAIGIVVCLLALFGVTWMIANMEDLNALLIRFVQS